MYPLQLYKNCFFVYNWGEQSGIDSNALSVWRISLIIPASGKKAIVGSDDSSKFI